MNYTDVFFSRVSHLGNNVAEIATNAGRRSFEKWLAESPNSPQEDLYIKKKGIFFRAIILTQKDDASKKIMELHVSVDTPVDIGDIIEWGDEKWIVWKKIKRVRETHQVFWMIRCNYFLKWIDTNGHLQEEWCYFVSTMDSKIKENYRTWSNLITPQPNKYGEILMPRVNIEKYTKFIVEEEGWYIVEYDKTSVPGTIYLSVTEDKINEINDDVVNEIANTDTLARYDFIFPEQEETFGVGEVINLTYSITKNGSPIPVPTEIILPDRKIVSYNENKELVGVSEGQVEVVIRLKDFPDIQTTRKIIITQTSPTLTGYIKGNETIKLDRKATYELIMTEEINDAVEFEINNPLLAAVFSVDNHICTVKANGKNKLGKVKLTAKYKGLEIEKEISIIPLW